MLDFDPAGPYYPHDYDTDLLMRLYQFNGESWSTSDTKGN